MNALPVDAARCTAIELRDFLMKFVLSKWRDSPTRHQ
jgi:hypothetical protein